MCNDCYLSHEEFDQLDESIQTIIKNAITMQAKYTNVRNQREHWIHKFNQQKQASTPPTP